MVEGGGGGGYGGRDCVEVVVVVVFGVVGMVVEGVDSDGERDWLVDHLKIRHPSRTRGGRSSALGAALPPGRVLEESARGGYRRDPSYLLLVNGLLKVFLHAIQHYSRNTAGRRLQLHAFVGIISMADAFKISRLSGNTESKWKKPWETSMTQEQAHLTGSLVTDRWFRPTGRHDVSDTTQGVKPRGGRGAFKRHQLASSPFRSAASTSGGGHGHLDMDDTGLGAKY
ncbi:uncharacterized protein LOC135094111 [Scylla paramamosain]|uniref:uncharacterized protein LOC135094111 n=1 Tax=Scylla paramamosain TaxID=85552 RepID=UPI003082F27F